MSRKHGTGKTRIALVDDQLCVLEGWQALLKAHPDVEVVLSALGGQELMDALPGVLPVDIVFVDMRMPVVDGPAVIRWLKAEYPHVAALAVSYFEDDATILAALNAGANGFLTKTADAHDYRTAVDHLRDTGYYRTHKVQDCLRSNPDGLTLEERVRAQMEKNLGACEKEVLAALLTTAELTNEGVGLELGKCKRTVDAQCKSIYDKLKVKGRVGMVLRAVSLGMVPNALLDEWRMLGSKTQ